MLRNSRRTSGAAVQRATTVEARPGALRAHVRHVPRYPEGAGHGGPERGGSKREVEEFREEMVRTLTPN